MASPKLPGGADGRAASAARSLPQFDISGVAEFSVRPGQLIQIGPFPRLGCPAISLPAKAIPIPAVLLLAEEAEQAASGRLRSVTTFLVVGS